MRCWIARFRRYSNVLARICHKGDFIALQRKQKSRSLGKRTAFCWGQADYVCGLLSLLPLGALAVSTNTSGSFAVERSRRGRGVRGRDGSSCT